MRLLSLRLIASLIVGIILVSLLSSYYSVRLEQQSLRRDLEHRAEMLGESLAVKRMQRMRKLVREQNIYRWAGDLIGQLCDVRLITIGKTPNKLEIGSSAA